MDISIRVDDAQTRRLLQRAADKSSDLRLVWGDLNANVVQPAMLKRFDTAGSHLGGPWRPLAPSTRVSRLRVGPRSHDSFYARRALALSGGGRGKRAANWGGLSRPLWDRNRLRRAWIKPSGESVIVKEKLKFERGVSVPYAAAHQQGGKNLPRRELVTEQLAEHVAKEAAERIARHVVARHGVE